MPKPDVLELDDEATKAIAAEVAKTLDIEKIVGDAATKAAEAVAAKGADKPVNKLKGGGTEDVPADDDEAGEVQKSAIRKQLEGEIKEVAFVRASRALVSGNGNVLREYNQMNIEKRAKAAGMTVEKFLEKSGYGNEETGSDGGFLVPDPDFDATVERLEEEFGVAVKYTDFGRVTGNAIKQNKKQTGFELYEITEEMGEIPGVKFSIGQITAQLRKFGGIAPASNELDEDSAVDYWKEVATEFATANAQKQTQLIFTDNTGTNKGIFEVSGTAAQSVGANPTDVDWDDLMDAEMKVPTKSAKNGRWYIHRTFMNVLAKKKGTDGHYIYTPNPNGLATPWGTPITLVDELPAVTDIANGGNQPFAAFGDLKHVKFRQKRGIVLTMLDQATIKDADGVTINLGMQDAKAMRGIVRMLSKIKFPEAFCVLGTGTVS
jgi:HK97 family phage major capsid protein